MLLRRVITVILLCTVLMTNGGIYTSRAEAAAVGNYGVSWLGNTFSGSGSSIPIRLNDVQMEMSAMSTAPDGTCYTNSSWDESHKLLGYYKDGNDLGQFKENTSSDPQWIWVHPDGGAVTANNTYTFASVKSGCFRRYRQSDKMPYGADVLVSTAKLTGLTIYNDELFVSDSANSKIKVYDINTLSYKREFDFVKPGKIAVDQQGYLWIMQESAPFNVYKYSVTGESQNVQISFESQVKPVAIAYNAVINRLMIADNGPDLNVKLYDPINVNGTPTNISSTFGQTGGIFSGVRGEYGHLKFKDLVGVGADNDGNIYVGMFRRSYGMSIESYTYSGAYRWKVNNNHFMDVSDMDQDSEEDVYSKNIHYKMDWSKNTPGTEAEVKGYTLDEKRYPQDVRYAYDPDKSYVLAIRRINGERFMYLTNMYSDYIAIYRFKPSTDGEIAIPSGFISRGHINGSWPPNQPSTGEWIWRDLNGNGAFDTGEFVSNGGVDAPYNIWGWSIDKYGDIWCVSYSEGIRKYDYQGLDQIGNPIYNYENLFTIGKPQPFTELRRIEYDANYDVMYLTGFTSDYPNPDNLWGKCAGRVIAKYENWSKGNRTASWRINDLLYVKGAETHTDKFITNISVAGNYIFTQQSRYTQSYNDQKTEVYRTSDGSYVGHMEAGSTASFEQAQIDLTHGMKAQRRSNGEYVAFVEDDWFGKIMMYRWNLGDTVPTPLPEPDSSKNFNLLAYDMDVGFDSGISSLSIERNNNASMGIVSVNGNYAVEFTDASTSNNTESTFSKIINNKTRIVNRINEVYSMPVGSAPVEFAYSFDVERRLASSKPVTSFIKASIEFGNYDNVLVPRFPTGEYSIYNTVAYKSNEADGSEVLERVGDSDIPTFKFKITPNGGARKITTLKLKFDARADTGGTPEAYAVDNLSIVEIVPKAQVESITFKSGDNYLYDMKNLEGNDTIQANVKICNNTRTAQNAIVLLALYNGDVLTGIKTIPVTFKSNEYQKEAVDSITLPPGSIEGYSFSCYVWNDLNAMYPIGIRKTIK